MSEIEEIKQALTIGDLMDTNGVRIRKVGKDDFRKAFFITNHPKAKDPEEYGKLNREAKQLSVIILIKNNGFGE